MREGLAKSAEDNLHPDYRRGLTDARKLGRTSKAGESPTEEFKESQKGELGGWGSILCGQTKGRWVYSRHSRDGHRRDPYMDLQLGSGDRGKKKVEFKVAADVS